MKPPPVKEIGLEEPQSTRSERWLAVVLTVFILIGTIWTYFQLDRTRDNYYESAPQTTIADENLVRQHDRLDSAMESAQSTRDKARGRLELTREAYRTALEAGKPTSALEGSYRRAEGSYRAASRRARYAQQKANAFEPKFRASQRRIQEANEAASERDAANRTHDQRVTFAIRLALQLLFMAFAFAIFNRMRRRHSRYLPIGLALTVAASIQALIMAVDYTTDVIDIGQFGPLSLSLAGAGMTLAAYYALQRYLARILPQRRVRKGSCPFCGYPQRGNEFCESCGRAALAACASCQRPRRVGTAHCGSCGSR